MHLLLLSDGKKGHENQSLGLAEAMLRRQSGTYELLNISEFGHGLQTQNQPRKTTAVIATGHSTHPFLLRLSRQLRCPSVVIMKPSLPSFLFSQCLIPEHDLKQGKRLSSKIIATKGALNRIPETIPAKTANGLIMLGGPSKHFDWEAQPLLDAVEKIVTEQPHLQWTLGDSRRTPADMLPLLTERLPALNIVSHCDAPSDWLMNEMLHSEVAWVTPDSTSMMFEALTADCRLGTLPLAPKGTRLSKAHDLLVTQGWLTPYQTYSPPLPDSALTLHESARCADILLDKLS